MYVYCAVNPSMPGLVKIGMTFDDPEIRMGQLSSNTAVPEHFQLVWSLRSTNPMRDEQQLHRTLASCRRSDKREFFACTPEFALSAARSIGLAVPSDAPKQHVLGSPVSEWKAAGVFAVLAAGTLPIVIYAASDSHLLWRLGLGFGWIVVLLVSTMIGMLIYEESASPFRVSPPEPVRGIIPGVDRPMLPHEAKMYRRISEQNQREVQRTSRRQSRRS
jgi:hypothetical protein